MPNREEYLKYLTEWGLTELDVLPLIKKNQILEKVEALLSLLASGNRITYEDFAPLLEGEETEKLAIAKTVLLLAGSKPREMKENEYAQLLLELHMSMMKENTNNLIQKLDSDLRKRLKKQDILLPEDVYIGVFPTNYFNAEAVKRKNGYLILLNNAIFELSEIAVGLILSEMRIERKGMLLAKLIRDFYEYNKLPDYQDYELTNQADSSLICHIVTSVEEFVIGHEYGHVVRGHFNNSAEVNLHEEIEADVWALKTLIYHGSDKMTEEFLAIACAGPFIFLTLALLLETFFKREGRFPDTHPSALDRINLLHYFFVRNELYEHIYVGERFNEIANICSLILFNKPLATSEPIVNFDVADYDKLILKNNSE